MPHDVRTIAHVGITVQNLQNAIELWRDVLGFELMGTTEVEGSFYDKVTGVPDLRVKVAFLTSGAHSIELAQFLSPADRQTFRPRPCDVGSMHVALEVADIDSVVEGCRRHGVLPVGSIQTLEEEPMPGTRLMYLHTPDGVTIELIQPPERT